MVSNTKKNAAKKNSSSVMEDYLEVISDLDKKKKATVLIKACQTSDLLHAVDVLCDGIGLPW